MAAQSGTHERSFQGRRLMFPSVMQRLVSAKKKELQKTRARFHHHYLTSQHHGTHKALARVLHLITTDLRLQTLCKRF